MVIQVRIKVDASEAASWNISVELEKLKSPTNPEAFRGVIITHIQAMFGFILQSDLEPG